MAAVPISVRGKVARFDRPEFCSPAARGVDLPQRQVSKV